MNDRQATLLELCVVLGFTVGLLRSDGTDYIAAAITGGVVGGAIGVAVVILFGLRSSPHDAGRSPSNQAGRWITARFPGRCRRCGGSISTGDRVLHSAREKKVACRACGGA